MSTMTHKSKSKCPNCGALIVTIPTMQYTKYLCQGCGSTRIEKGVKVLPKFTTASEINQDRS